MGQSWKHRARWVRIIALLVVVLLIVVLISCSVGAVRISPMRTVGILIDSLPLISLDGEWSATEKSIITGIRVPRVAMGAMIGLALAIAGASFQSLLRNPLADPYILGVSSGGALGAIIAISLGVNLVFGVPALPFFSFLGATLTMFLVYGIARVRGRVPTHTLLLAGVIVNSFFSAFIMFFVSIARLTHARTFQFWTMGDLNLPIGRTALTVAVMILVGAVMLYSRSKEMNLLALGEESAAHLGVEVERTKLIVFVFASLITGASVAACGMIGFVGLIIPHITRMLVGADQRILLPASGLMGASFLVLADAFARTIIAPGEIPIGVVTAICGGPFFIYLLRRQRKPLL